jgi:peptidoglycan L-alanyl-D-glutamate endopeptidase CwlK
VIKYGRTSLGNIKTLDNRMYSVCHAAIAVMNRRKIGRPDFGISSGRRTAVQQNILWQQGRTVAGPIITYRDGYEIESTHQSGMAVDFFAYIDGRADYDPGNLALIALCFAEGANALDLKWKWGGNFPSFFDGAHFECF